MSRQDEYTVTASFDGVPTIGDWDKLSGGDVDSDDTKYHPGGMVDPISLGGRRTVNNVTIQRLFRKPRDINLGRSLLPRIGRGEAVITKQPLDEDGNPNGQPLVYNGKIKHVTWPDADSESSAAALIQVEISSATVTQH